LPKDLTLALNPLKTSTIEPVPFKVQDLPEDLTLASNLPKTLTIEPALLISPAFAIPKDLTLASNLPKTLTIEPALPISPAIRDSYFCANPYYTYDLCSSYSRTYPATYTQNSCCFVAGNLYSNRALSSALNPADIMPQLPIYLYLKKSTSQALAIRLLFYHC
jgi:hypothetical protein